MTILSRPLPSRSFRSWKVIAGGPQLQLCVQERTEEGMRKNKGVAHRLFYGEVDHKRYRIIRSTNNVDYLSITGGSEENFDGVNIRGSQRLVLASSDSREEIMKDWNAVTSAGTQMLDWDRGLHVSQWSSASSLGHPGSDFSPFQRSPNCVGRPWIGGSVPLPEGAAGASVLSELSCSSVPLALPQQPGDTVNAYDACLIRIMGLWRWDHPIETLVYMIVLTVCWWQKVLHWSFIFAISFFVGFVRCRQPLSEKEGNEGRAQLMYVQSFFCANVSKSIIYSISAVVTLHWCIEWLAPQWTLMSIMEYVLPPLMMASFLHTGLMGLSGYSPVDEGCPYFRKHKYGASHVPTCLPPASTNAVNPTTQTEMGFIPQMLPRVDAVASNTSLFREDREASVPCSLGVSPGLGRWQQRESFTDGFTVWERTDTSSTTLVVVEVNVPRTGVGSLQAVLAGAVCSEAQGSHFYQWNEAVNRQTLVNTKHGVEFTFSTVYTSDPLGNKSCREDSFPGCVSSPTTTQGSEQSEEQTSFSRENSAASVTPRASAAGHLGTPVVAPPFSVRFAQREGLIVWNYDIVGLERKNGSLRLRACYNITSRGNLHENTRGDLAKQLSRRVEALVQLLGVSDVRLGTLTPPQGHQCTTPEYTPTTCSETPAVSEGHVGSGAPGDNDKRATDAGEPLQIVKFVVRELFLKCKWELLFEKKGAKVWTAKTRWSDKKAVKVAVHVPHVTLADVDCVVNDPKLVNEMDKAVKAKILLGKMPSGVHIYHTKFSSPFWGIAARDVVTRTVPSCYPNEAERVAMGLDEHTPVFVQASVNGSREVPELEGFVRGYVFAFCVVAEAEVGSNGEEGVLLSRCVAADPGGVLPAYVVNLLSVMQLDSILTFAKFVSKRAAERVKGSASPPAS